MDSFFFIPLCPMKQRQYELRYFTFLSLLLCSMIGFYQLGRILFYLLNTSFFELGFAGVVKTLFYGTRFDISAILYLNSIFIILWLIPLRYRMNNHFCKIMKWLFVVINSIALFANLADIIYFRFTLKRTTADIFSYLSVGGEFDKLLPQFLKDFWYIFILFAAMVYGLIKLYQLIEKKTLVKHETPGKSSYFIQGSLFVFVVLMTVFGMRGGIQLRPINIITAGKYMQGNNSVLILNTPFTILQTIGKQELKLLDFYKDKELNEIYNPRHQSLINNVIPKERCNKKNIVIIIVESLSMEHMGFFNQHVSGYKGFTPFLDSIAKRSLAFNGFANGKKSIEGIPAILSGVPTMMNTPFINSPYSGNQFVSLPMELRKRGYSTSFFHGGANGTMGFDTYCKAAGFIDYIGKNQYPNKAKDDDGSWGIWDEPFLSYFAQQLNNTREPFLSAIFTLSSHHPFKIPAQYTGKFPAGKLPIQQTIAYTDYSLAQFFAKASHSKWYSNTLFVITADHTSESSMSEYGNDYGQFRIPILFYDPMADLSVYSSQQTAQQIDIMPTVLSYLGIDHSLFSFGNNLLDTNALHFAINYKQPNYQLLMGDYLALFDGVSTIALYNVAADKMMKENLLSKNPKQNDRSTRILKAFLQQYNAALINNRMNQ